MTRKLFKHNLDYDKAVEYLKDQLDCGYVLSEELLNSLNFENGQFFTLLPEDAELKRLYDFFGGLILPQNETKAQINEKTGEKSYYTWIPTLDEEIMHLIYEEVCMNENFMVIFEDVKKDLTSKHLDFFYKFGFTCRNQIYYLLNKKNISLESVGQGMGESSALWHQLFILTEADKPDLLDKLIPEKEVDLTFVKELCKGIKLLVLGAYDGEGYFFWEPNGKSSQFFYSNCE